MKNLLTDIQTRLAAALTPDSQQLFQYVDLDWGQVDFYETPPVKYPCALLDINAATYTNEGQLAQIGIITIQVRILDIVLSNTSAQAPAEQRTKATHLFTILNEANRLLHGFHGEGYGRLTKQAISRVKRRDGLKEYTLTFSVQLTDTSALPVRQRVSNIEPVILTQP